MRNSLGVINNAVYLQALLSDADAATKESLDIIKGGIADAERIVSDLLNAVRTQPPHQEILDIAEIISQTLRKCDIPSSVTVSLDIPAPLSLARADPMRLHQVLWNLITSDLEAMPRSGALAVRRKRIKPRIPCVSASRIAPSVLCRNSRQNCSSLFHRQGAPYRTVLAG